MSVEKVGLSTSKFVTLKIIIVAMKMIPIIMVMPMASNRGTFMVVKKYEMGRWCRCCLNLGAIVIAVSQTSK